MPENTPEHVVRPSVSVQLPESFGEAACKAIGLAQPVVGAACKLITDLLGKPCKVAGALLADQLYSWQWRNRLRIAARASEILDSHQVPHKVLPPGFLMPLLDAAGQVDEPELQEIWAKLLAAGVMADAARHPLFLETVKRLSPEDARFFTRVLRDCNGQFVVESLPPNAIVAFSKVRLFADLIPPVKLAPGEVPWDCVARLQVLGVLTRSETDQVIPASSIAVRVTDFGRQLWSVISLGSSGQC